MEMADERAMRPTSPNVKVRAMSVVSVVEEVLLEGVKEAKEV